MLATIIILALVSLWPLYKIARWVLVRWVDPLLERNLPRPDENSESGTSQGLSVLAFILTQAVAITASQIGRTAIADAPDEYQWKVGGFFAVLTVVVLGSVIGLIRSTGMAEDKSDDADEAAVQPVKVKRKRTFDHGSLFFFKWVLAWGVSLSAATGCLAWYGWLPTQATSGHTSLNEWAAEQKKIEPIADPVLREMQPSNFVNKPAIRIEVPISPSQFQDGVPKEMVATVTIKPSTIKSGWRVIDADLFDGDPDKKIKHKPAAAISRNISDPSRLPVTRFDAKLSELQSGESYTLVIWLWKSGVSEQVASEFATTLNQQREKAVDVQATWTRY